MTKLCTMCNQEINKDNTFTKDGWKETEITGLCEVCFDHSTFSLEENLEHVFKDCSDVKLLVDMEGVMIGGGALRRLVTPSDEIMDYDLFFTKASAVENVKSILLGHTNQCLTHEWKMVFECPRGELYTFKNNSGDKIQLITKRYYTSIAELIASFDITACCCAYDGKYIVSNRRFVSDVTNKRIYLNTVEYPAATIKRIAKYVQKGYMLPSTTALEYVMMVGDMKLTEENMALYVD